MWKWLAVFCLCYGLLGMAAFVAPQHRMPLTFAERPPRPPREGQPLPRDGQPPQRPLAPGQLAPGGMQPPAPGGAPPPAAQGLPPQLLNFEGPLPRFVVRPEGPDSVQIIAEPNGNHVLAWTTLSSLNNRMKAPLAVLEIPLTPGISASELRFRARAILPDKQQPAPDAGAHEFIIGVGEAGGPVYRVRRSIGPQWADYAIALAELREGPLEQAPAGAVDPARVDRFVVAYKLSYLAGKRLASAVQLELDDIEVR